MDRPRPSFGQRPSKSADEARRQQIDRVLAMTPRERAMLALRLGRRMIDVAARASRPR